MRSKVVISRFFIILILVLIIVTSPTDVRASNWQFESTNRSVNSGSWYKVFDSLSAGDVMSGYVETESDSKTLDFFICDSYNLGEWEAGRSANVYELTNNVHVKQFSFTVPTSDTWYAVFSNRYGLSTVTADIAVETNDDNSPWYDSTMYTTTKYGEVLEPGWHYYVYNTYTAGTTLYGHVSTWFSTDGVDVFICDQANYNIWYNGGTATKYNLKTNMHITPIESFVIPYDDTWYLVIDSADADTITISFGFGYFTSTSVVGVLTVLPIAVGVIAIVGLIGFAIVYSNTMRKRRVEHPSYVATPTIAKVLVICPYCGFKNEQGVTRCGNCHAEI